MLKNLWYIFNFEGRHQRSQGTPFKLPVFWFPSMGPMEESQTRGL